MCWRWLVFLLGLDMMFLGCKVLVRLATSVSTATRSSSTTSISSVFNVSLNSFLCFVVILVMFWNLLLVIVYEYLMYGMLFMKIMGFYARLISAFGSYVFGRNTRTFNFGGLWFLGMCNGVWMWMMVCVLSMDKLMMFVSCLLFGILSVLFKFCFMKIGDDRLSASTDNFFLCLRVFLSGVVMLIIVMELNDGIDMVFVMCGVMVSLVDVVLRMN